MGTLNIRLSQKAITNAAIRPKATPPTPTLRNSPSVNQKPVCVFFAKSYIYLINTPTITIVNNNIADPSLNIDSPLINEANSFEPPKSYI